MECGHAWYNDEFDGHDAVTIIKHSYNFSGNSRMIMTMIMIAIIMMMK